jgi:hypothetical protein
MKGDTVSFLFADHNNLTVLETLRKYLSTVITKKKRVWRGNVVAIAREDKLRDSVILLNVFTQTITKTILCDGLIDEMILCKETTLGITEVSQLRDGTLVVLTTTPNFYVYKETMRKIPLKTSSNKKELDSPTCLTQLSNGWVAMGTQYSVLVFNTNWRIEYVLEAENCKCIAETFDGRLVSGGTQAKVWKNFKLEQQSTGNSWRRVWEYQPGIMLLQDEIGTSVHLWDLQTNKLTLLTFPGIERATMFSGCGTIFGIYGNILRDIKTEKEVDLGTGNKLSTYWRGAMCQVEPGVVAWPGPDHIIVYDTRIEKVVHRYEFDRSRVARWYVLE